MKIRYTTKKLSLLSLFQVGDVVEVINTETEFDDTRYPIGYQFVVNSIWNYEKEVGELADTNSIFNHIGDCI